MIKRTYAQIQQSAGCAWKLKILAQCLAKEPLRDMSGEYPTPEAKELGIDLAGIEAVLKILAYTPNAYVNREALDAMEQRIDEAREMLGQEWAIDMLGRSDTILGLDKSPDYIPW